MEERERAAYHEAGHAVAALRFGQDCYGAHIISHGDNMGATDTEGSWHDLKSAQEMIISLYAGFAASLKIDPGADYSGLAYAATEDSKKADDIMLAIGNEDRKAWMSQTHDFVEKNWEAIELVALELLEREYLDGTELEILINIADGKDHREDLVSYRTMRDAG
jgi:ATP-dependent Zn protease